MSIRHTIMKNIVVFAIPFFLLSALPARAACPAVGSCGALTAAVSPMPIGDSVQNWQPNNFYVTLTWSAAPNLDCGYEKGQYILECTNPTWGFWASGDNLDDRSTTSIYTVFGGAVGGNADPIGCTWQFRVHAYLLDTTQNMQNGPYSSVSVYIPGALQAPQSFSASASSKGINLSWQPPAQRLDGSSNPIPNKGYNIYRDVGSSNDSLVTVTVANATSWTDSNVITNKTYYYTIYPFDAYSYGLFATASAKAVAGGVRNGVASAVGHRGIECRNGIVTVGVDRAMRVSVVLFNLTGKKIAVAFDAFAAAGIYRVPLVAAQAGQLVLVRVQRGDAMQAFEALAPAKGTWSR